MNIGFIIFYCILMQHDQECYEKGLIVEADGGQHALEKEKDEERTQWLNSQGFHGTTILEP